MIEKTTTLFALIGDNLAHDKRPQIINYLFGQGNDDAALIPMNIRPDDLPFTLKGLKQSQIKGAIIDSLHYHEAYRACDQVPQGENVPDIVDTIEIINGELVGKFFLPLDLAHSLPFDGKRVLIIGTTPLAFALGSTLGSLPITSLTYGAPTLEEAHAFTSKLKVISSLEEEWFSTTRAIDLSSYDIIINATTHKNNDQEQLPHFKNGDHTKIFIDFHLTLEETYISKTATLVGAKAILGYDMALFQARGAYQRWLNKAPVINNEHLTIITEDFTRECQLTKGLTNG